MDLYAQCQARFITPGTCTICANPTYNMCDDVRYATDKTCVSACPTYLYFAIGRVSTGDYRSVDFAAYSSYMGVTQSYVNGNNDATTYTEQYRLGTNLCMICDVSCLTCYGPTNKQCSTCTNGYHKWLDQPYCFLYCPTVAIS